MNDLSAAYQAQKAWMRIQSDLLRGVVPAAIAQDIVSVQPMAVASSVVAEYFRRTDPQQRLAAMREELRQAHADIHRLEAELASAQGEIAALRPPKPDKHAPLHNALRFGTNGRPA